MNFIKAGETEISIPMPLYPVIEDVGWWQGSDDSKNQQPYRNRFSRNHTIDDYKALIDLARDLSIRLAIGMVIGEWDRSDHLAGVPGATWMGKDWDNSINNGPWLDHTSELLNDNSQHLEIGVHGLCHEYWENGIMSRSEFHNADGVMRPAHTIKKHLDAYWYLLAENSIRQKPKLFIPPALNHSFGRGSDSMQAILYRYGIRYVITKFDRALIHSPPAYNDLTWEEGVYIIERGSAPAPWYESGAEPPKEFSGPIIPLHWVNLLHQDPSRNQEVTGRWKKRLRTMNSNFNYILARDIERLFRQFAAHKFSTLKVVNGRVEIDLGDLPDKPVFTGPFYMKIRQGQKQKLRLFSNGGTIKILSNSPDHLLEVTPDSAHPSSCIQINLL